MKKPFTPPESVLVLQQQATGSDNHGLHWHQSLEEVLLLSVSSNTLEPPSKNTEKTKPYLTAIKATKKHNLFF